MVEPLLGLLELNNVSLGVPTIQDDVSAEVPCASLGLEMAARGLRRFANCCEAGHDKGWLERRFLTWLGRLGDRDARRILARDGVYCNLVPMTS